MGVFRKKLISVFTAQFLNRTPIILSPRWNLGWLTLTWARFLSHHIRPIDVFCHAISNMCQDSFARISSALSNVVKGFHFQGLQGYLLCTSMKKARNVNKWLRGNWWPMPLLVMKGQRLSLSADDGANIAHWGYAKWDGTKPQTFNF